MKKLTGLIVVGCLLALMGCGAAGEDSEDTTAAIRFQNSFSDESTILYGIRVGGAIHNGSIANPGVTPYYRTEAGTYSIQWKMADGSWVSEPITCTVTAGHDFTLLLTGTPTTGTGLYYYTLITDSK